METIEIKNKIQTAIERLSQEQLQMALDLLEDLQRSEDDETSSLLNEPGFIEDYRQAQTDIRTGQTIPWEDIKRDIYFPKKKSTR